MHKLALSKVQRICVSQLIERAARAIIQPGDRVRALRGVCGMKRPQWYVVIGWDRGFLASASFNDIIPETVDRLNDEPINLFEQAVLLGAAGLLPPLVRFNAWGE